jgi:DnaJ-class molecular chaperone
MWEVCPLCKGQGYEDIVISHEGISQPVMKFCTVCNGRKIISTTTGLPPSGDKLIEPDAYDILCKLRDELKNKK